MLYSVWSLIPHHPLHRFHVKKVEKSMRPSALFGLEKSKKWRPNGALGPYGFWKNESNHVGSVKT